MCLYISASKRSFAKESITETGDQVHNVGHNPVKCTMLAYDRTVLLFGGWNDKIE